MNTNKFLYGFLAFAPIIGLLLMFLFMGLLFTELITSIGDHRVGPYENEWDMPYYAEMMVAAIASGLTSLIGLILYVLHSQNNIHIPQDKRVMWTVILVLAGAIGILIYYFTWISKEDKLNAEHQVRF